MDCCGGYLRGPATLHQSLVITCDKYCATVLFIQDWCAWLRRECLANRATVKEAYTESTHQCGSSNSRSNLHFQLLDAIPGAQYPAQSPGLSTLPVQVVLETPMHNPMHNTKETSNCVSNPTLLHITHSYQHFPVQRICDRFLETVPKADACRFGCVFAFVQFLDGTYKYAQKLQHSISFLAKTYDNPYFLHAV